MTQETRQITYEVSQGLLTDIHLVGQVDDKWTPEVAREAIAWYCGRLPLMDALTHEPREEIDGWLRHMQTEGNFPEPAHDPWRRWDGSKDNRISGRIPAEHAAIMGLLARGYLLREKPATLAFIDGLPRPEIIIMHPFLIRAELPLAKTANLADEDITRLYPHGIRAANPQYDEIEPYVKQDEVRNVQIRAMSGYTTAAFLGYFASRRLEEGFVNEVRLAHERMLEVFSPAPVVAKHFWEEE